MLLLNQDLNMKAEAGWASLSFNGSPSSDSGLITEILRVGGYSSHTSFDFRLDPNAVILGGELSSLKKTTVMSHFRKITILFVRQ